MDADIHGIQFSLLFGLMGKRHPIDPEEKESRSVRRDVIVCLCAGLFIATGFSVWVLGLYLFRGNTPFEKLGTTLGAVILTYYCAAILIGPLAGLLLPLARAGRPGAALVGALTAVPLYAMVLITLEGIPSWTPRTAFVILVPALFVGVPVGLVCRRMFDGRL